MPMASATGIVSDVQIAACAKQAGWTGGNVAIAVAVALAESSGRADAVNYLGCTGLWQVYVRVHIKAHPLWTTQWLKNPANNAIAAHEVWKSQGWSRGWTTYHSGSYKRFMSRANQAVAGSGGVAAGTFAPSDASGGTEGAFSNLTNPQTYKRIALILIGIVVCFTAINLMTLDTRLKIASAALNVVPGGGVAKNVIKGTAKATAKAAIKKAVAK